MKKIKFLDKYGYPIEIIKGKYIQNIIRRMIHTRRLGII